MSINLHTFFVNTHRIRLCIVEYNKEQNKLIIDKTFVDPVGLFINVLFLAVNS